jgi:antitoxin component YwqK of YwqJK toxin-antitoxin module
MSWSLQLWVAASLAAGSPAKPSDVTLDCPGTATQRSMKTETGRRVACYTADLELDGPVLDFDARGVKRFEFVISDRNQVGPMRGWHPNGAPCFEASLGDGTGSEDGAGDRRPRLQGPVTEWDPDGKKTSEGAFKDGLPDGVARAWSPPAVLRRECSWANGKPNGSWKSFFPDGKPETQLTMSDGRAEGQVLHWWPNGRKREELTLANELPEGVRREWSEEGVLLSETTYSDGRKNGPFREFHPNGKPKHAGTYARGQVEGPFQQWYESGQLQSSGAFLADERHGPWKGWHPNGQLARVATFDKGRELPGWTTFFADGKPSARLSKAGAYERFYPGGALREKGTIGPKERRQGKWIWFGQNGKPERIGTYQAGRLNGEVISMGEDGKPAHREQFRKGLLASPPCPPGGRVSRNEEQRQLSCLDAKGEQHGPQYLFDEDGRYTVSTYDHGVLQGLRQNGSTDSAGEVKGARDEDPAGAEADAVERVDGAKGEPGEDRVCRSVLTEAFQGDIREWHPQPLEVKPSRTGSDGAQPARPERSAP